MAPTLFAPSCCRLVNKIVSMRRSEFVFLIWEVPSSCLDDDITHYFVGCSWFSSIPPEKCLRLGRDYFLLHTV